MKKLIVIAAAALSLASGYALAAKVQDMPDLREAHRHIQNSINEMDRARAANHYDMSGHGAKAEQLMRQAELELRLAIDVAESQPAKPQAAESKKK
jgi:hypothetical protein